MGRELTHQRAWALALAAATHGMGKGRSGGELSQQAPWAPAMAAEEQGEVRATGDPVGDLSQSPSRQLRPPHGASENLRIPVISSPAPLAVETHPLLLRYCYYYLHQY